MTNGRNGDVLEMLQVCLICPNNLASLQSSGPIAANRDAICLTPDVSVSGLHALASLECMGNSEAHGTALYVVLDRPGRAVLEPRGRAIRLGA